MATYTVLVDENSHHGDVSERYTKGAFETYEEALAVARGIVEDFLEKAYREGITARDLLGQYRMFGEDPHIVPDDGDPGFSAWDHAEAVCRRLCG